MSYSLNTSNKTATCDGDAASINAAIAAIRNRAEDDWDLAFGTAGETCVWTDRVVVDVGGRPFTLRGGSATTSVRSTFISTAGGLDLICGAGPVHLKDFRILEWACAQWFVFIGGHGICFHFTNLYVANGGRWTDPADGQIYPINFYRIAGHGDPGGGAGPFGLIENSFFDNADAVGNSGFMGLGFVRQNSDSPDWNWADDHDPQPGSFNAVYFQRNHFVNIFVADGNAAGKVVIRDCIMENSVCGMHGRDSDNYEDDYQRSFFWREIYRNRYIVNRNISSFPLCQIRGGSGYFFENTLVKEAGGVIGAGFQLEMHCCNTDNINHGEYCRDGTNGAYMTHPLTYPADYPDRQMAGRPTIGGVASCRSWDNSPNTTDFTSGTWMNATQDFTALGRDYFIDEPPVGYTPAGTHPLSVGAPLAAPTNNFPPRIIGQAAQGQTLTISPQGGWSGNPDVVKTHQWTVCDINGANCVNIAGATGLTYVITSAEVGKTIRACETATNSQGSATACSIPTDVISAPGATNRITNAGFESRMGAIDNLNNDAVWTGWNVTSYDPGYIMSTTDSHSGTYALKVYKNTGTNIMAIEQAFVPANAGQSMTLSFWFKNDTPNYSATFYIRDLTNNADIIAPTQVVDSIGSYTQLATTFVVPTGCVLAKIGFNTSHMSGVLGGGGTSMWIDDVVVAPPATVDPDVITNVARNIYGSSAVASSETPGYEASYVIDGDRRGLASGFSWHGWNDSTSATFPDSLEVRFGQARTINEIDVFTLADGFPTQPEPTESTTALTYGAKDFLVQYWDGSSWVTLGTVTNNSLAWRKFTFAEITTTKIRVYVTAANDGGSSRLIEVEAYTPGANTDPIRPENTDLPVLNANHTVGQTINVSNGTWIGNPALTFTYQWQSCDNSGGRCINLSGATSSSYVIQGSDVGSTLKCTVTGSNSEGAASATSGLSAVIVAPVSAPSNTVAPTLNGNHFVSQTITTTSGSWSGNPTPTLTYQWKKCDGAGANCINISSATSASYVIQFSDIDATLKCVVTATNTAGSATASTAVSSVIVPAFAVPTNVTPPSLNGNNLVTQTATCTAGTWNGNPAPTFGYQWKRCDINGTNCLNIAGATNPSYIIQTADIGSKLVCQVTAANSQGALSVTSSPTAVVALIPVSSSPQQLFAARKIMLIRKH